MYKYWVQTWDGGFSAQEIEDKINELARSGWRLVSSSNYNGKLVAFFEKVA